MAVVPKRLARGETTSGRRMVYTAPAGTTTLVKALTICNNGLTEQVFGLELAGTYLIAGYKVKPFQTLTIPFMDQVIHSGESIFISGNSTAVNFYISGKEVT